MDENGVQSEERDEREWLPEVAAAMIELAIEDMTHGAGRDASTRRGRRARDAAAWVFERRAARFSFAAACGLLGFDLGATRAAIRRKTGWSG